MKWSLWTKTVAAIAVAMCWLTLGAVANAAVLCARPRTDGTFNASVRIREMCRANERQLDPSALGLQGPLGPQGPVGPSGPQGAIGTQGPAGPGLAVKDVKGTVVGQVLQEVNAGSGRAAVPCRGALTSGGIRTRGWDVDFEPLGGDDRPRLRCSACPRCCRRATLGAADCFTRGHNATSRT